MKDIEKIAELENLDTAIAKQAESSLQTAPHQQSHTSYKNARNITSKTKSSKAIYNATDERTKKLKRKIDSQNAQSLDLQGMPHSTQISATNEIITDNTIESSCHTQTHKIHIYTQASTTQTYTIWQI